MTDVTLEIEAGRFAYGQAVWYVVRRAGKTVAIGPIPGLVVVLGGLAFHGTWIVIAIVTLIQDPTGWLLAGITVGLALVSPLVAGAAAYAQNRGGLPQEYRDATLVHQAVVGESEAVADQDAAVARVLLRRDLKG